MKFAIGDKVVEKKSIHPHTSFGVMVVAAFFEDSYLLKYYGNSYEGHIDCYDYDNERPGTRFWRESIQRYEEKELLSLDEALEQIKVLQSDKMMLENQFNKAKNEIQDKLNAAAILVEEAGKLVDAFDKTLYDLKTECLPLYNALDKYGWSHSSMSC
jgi:hypothetical protein